jgi:hypothetical protein
MAIRQQTISWVSWKTQAAEEASNEDSLSFEIGQREVETFGSNFPNHTGCDIAPQ